MNYSYCGDPAKRPTPENAYQLAELMALDYSIKEDDEWVGCAINVCSVDGIETIAVPAMSSRLRQPDATDSGSVR